MMKAWLGSAWLGVAACTGGATGPTTGGAKVEAKADAKAAVKPGDVVVDAKVEAKPDAAAPGEEKETQGLKSAQLMDRDDMSSLFSPWLGSEAAGLQDLPAPSLITIELKTRDEKVIRGITRMVKEIAETARIDAHEAWLSDLVRMTNLLKFSALLVMLAIGLVTVLTVAGAVRSRMAIHHGELELLPIMGADDKYISLQFQKYIYALTGKGVLFGFIVSALVVGGLQVAAIT